MNQPNRPQNKQSDTDSSKHQNSETPSFQPESGAMDREERMEIRQSSPTNPRVTDKSEVNQEEA